MKGFFAAPARSGLIVAGVLLLWSPASSAALYAEYDGLLKQDTTQGARLTSLSSTGGDLSYVRKMFITDGILAFQIVVEGVVVKEVGFDFFSSVYFEAEPVKYRFRRYTLNRVREEYAMLKTAALSPEASLNLFEGLFSEANDRFLDFPLSAHRSFFGGKKILDMKADLYRQKVEFSQLSPFGGKSEISWRIWTVREAPFHDEYLEAANALKREAAFYKAKDNEVSDAVIAMMAAPGFPAEIKSERRGTGFGAGYSRTIQEKLSKLSTRSFDRNLLYYYREPGLFLTDLRVEREGSAGTATGGGVPEFVRSRTPVEGLLNLLEIVFTLSVIVLFILGGLWRWYTRESADHRLLIAGYDLSGGYGIVLTLFLLLVVHGLTMLPFLGSLLIEFSVVTVGGVGLIFLERYWAASRARQMAKAGKGQICPGCKRFVDLMCAICPACKRRL